MSATDELRRLLDERGVEYMEDRGYREFFWGFGEGCKARASGIGTRGLVQMIVTGITPEQAVEATLGKVDKVYAVGGIIAQAECRDVCSSVSEFTCSVCGFNCELTSWISLFDGDVGRHRHHHHGTPNYCPNCGAKVVDA